jgi:16S rRNA (adenine1518-N6/adenine1519-N6)-dimethyltransferase
LKLTSPKVISEIMKCNDIAFTKSLGQNFLIDENILNKVVAVAEVTKDDYILEVGPGIGALTAALANRAKKVVAIEIDKGIIPVLRKSVEDFDNVEVIEGDVLKVDLAKLAQENFDSSDFKVVANLPYYITTPVIMKLLSAQLPIRVMVFMVQKEVAQRMSALPGSKEYGALSVAVQFYSKARTEFKVPPSAFMPRPKVDSAVVRLKTGKPPVEVEDTQLFFKVVRLAFLHRRKTLGNALAMGDLGLDRESIRNILTDLGIDPQRRGETLSLQEFAKIVNVLLGLRF